MDKTEWGSRTVVERMKTCCEESKTVSTDGFYDGAVAQAVYAVGLYQAYQSKFGV